MQGTRTRLWASVVPILAKLGTLQMEQLRNEALVILQRWLLESLLAFLAGYILPYAVHSKVSLWE